MATYAKTTEAGNDSFFALPVVGTALTVAAGLSFQFLCMVLPVVGKAGMNPDREYAVRGLTSMPGAHGFDSYVADNKAAFLVALAVSLVLAIAAFASKYLRRRIDGSPFPHFSLVLVVCCVGLLMAHLTGTLQL